MLKQLLSPHEFITVLYVSKMGKKKISTFSPISKFMFRDGQKEGFLEQTLPSPSASVCKCKCYWNLKVAICFTQMGLCCVHPFYCDVHVVEAFERCLE